MDRNVGCCGGRTTCVVDRAGTRAFTRGVDDGELIVNDQAELHDDREQHHDNRQYQRELTVAWPLRLAGVASSEAGIDDVEDVIEQGGDSPGPTTAGCPRDE